MSLFPKTRHPYYIVCPGYSRKSAGIKALYLLCHHLNRSGYPAYLVLQPWADLEFCSEINTDLIMPLLTKMILDRHLADGTFPITFYTETISGNPFNAPCVARFYGNFPELLGGTGVSDKELNFGYSQVLAEAIGSPDNILFIPTVNTSVFHPSDQVQERKGTCYYAAKYKETHFEKTFAVTDDSIEITRRTEDWSPERIAQTFRTSELFYAYENSMLITEAIICGCPAVMLPNPHMTQSIGNMELGDYGLGWGTSPEQIRYAKETVHLGWEMYNRSLELFPKHLAAFIEKTQAYADKIYGG